MIGRTQKLAGERQGDVLLRGRCLLHRGQHEEVLALASNLLDRQPPVEAVVVSLARLAEEAFRHETSIGLWTMLRDRGFSTDDAAAVGRLQLKAHHPEEAVASWRVYVARGADGAARLSRAMEAARHLGDFDRVDDAVALLDEGLSQRPDDLDAVRLRASLLWRSNRRDDAVASLDAWLARAPEPAAALENALGLLAAWEGWTEGLRLLSRLRRDGDGVFPTDIAATALLYSGLFRTKLGDLEPATKHFDEFLKVEGNVGRARARIGALLLTSGDSGRALPWLEAAFTKKPRWPTAAPHLASACHTLDLGDRIPGIFDDYVARSTDKGTAWAEAAAWWFGVGRIEEALAASTRAVALVAEARPALLLLHGRLLLTTDGAQEEAFSLLEAAAAGVSAGDLVEIWRLVSQRSGRHASCVRAAVLQRPEARIGVSPDGRRALILPATGGEGTFPLDLEAELNDLLGCDRGEIDARIEAYLAESQDAAGKMAMANSLIRALLAASYPDRAADLIRKYPAIPIQPPRSELRLIEVLLPRAKTLALARLGRLATSPVAPEIRLEGTAAFLAADNPGAAETILGKDWGGVDDTLACHAERLRVEARLTSGHQDEAMDLGRDLASRCSARPDEVLEALNLLVDRGPAADAFDLAVDLLDRLQTPALVRQIVVAAVRAGRRAGLSLDVVGERLAQASKGWKGEVEVAGVLAATGRFRAAVKLLEAAWRRNPREGVILKRLLNLHRMARLSGRPGALSRVRIVEMCEQHIMANERSEESVLTILATLDGLALTDIALELADRFVDKDTSNSGLLLLRASLALTAGRGDEAAPLLGQAAAVTSNLEGLVDTATGMLSRYGHHEEVLRIIEKGLELHPENPDLIMRLAWRLSIGPAPDWDRVANLVAGVVRRVPAHLERGTLILLGGNRFDLAVPILEEIRNSADERASWSATRLLLTHAADTGAHGQVRAVVAAYAGSKIPAFRLQSLADLLFEHGYLLEGLTLLDEHGGKNPDNVAGILRALKLIQAGRTGEGLDLIDNFFEMVVLRYRKLARNPVMTPELHKLFDSVNDFLWDMGLKDSAGPMLDRALEAYPEDAALVERRCRSLLADPEGSMDQALALFRRLLDLPGEPAAPARRTLVHHLAARGLGAQAAGIMRDAFNPAHPAWWTPMLLELLVVQDKSKVLGRIVEQLASRPAPSAALLVESGAALLARGRPNMARLLVRQAILRTHRQGVAATLTPKATSFSRLTSEVQAAPPSELKIKLVVLLVRAMAADGATPATIHAAARDTLRAVAGAGGISPESRLLLASTLDEAEIWDAALAEWGLQQALGEGSAAPYLREFRIHLIRGDEAAARETLWRCLATNPGTAGVLTRFAEQARRILALDLSTELFAMAVRLDGGNLALAYAAAEPLLLLGREDEARALLEVYAGEGGGATPRNQRLEAATLAYRYNRFALAEDILGGVDTAASWLERSRNHLRAGETSQGWRLFEEALKRAHNPTEAARALLATLLKATAPDLKLIANLLAKAQAPAENPSVNRYWEGVLLLDRGRWNSALRSFNEGLSGTRARFGLGLTMVKALLARGRVKDAEAFAFKAFTGFKAAAVRTELAKAIAESLHAEQIPAKHRAAAADLGVRAARDALAADPVDTWVLTQLAEVQFAAKRTDDAIRIYDKAMADLPGDSGMENNLAYLLALTGRETERGLALVKAAIRREPGHNIFYLDTLGWLQYGQGRLEDAERNIRAALLRADFTTPSGLAEALYHLGKVQKDQGRLEEAREAFHRASVNDRWGLYGNKARTELEKLGVDPYHR